MSTEVRKTLRCAIYTRKSTEHGLEQEFNSLDAQREACEAYIASQASQGWRVLAQRYDDPAYSGGNLDRPALKGLLRDIEAGRIDVVVVYKIDRLTRSLADFAKLVETFDARSISFVAVTQHFNTTTSMGRLTLNVLLSFAQFERELASERVRDKVAASRTRGKWTGGTVPLGYDAMDKKLVVNEIEAECVRTIFRRYLDLKSFSRLAAELDKRGIVTKRRNAKVQKYQGGIPFTYGPLAYLLKSRIYLGEIHHGGKWFKGEHEAIVDWQTFQKVQELLKSNAVKCKTKYSESGALLKSKLFDDKGNRMSPSFSSKNGVRYRFYVSTALRGRKSQAGSVPRIAAREIEDIVEHTIREKFNMPDAASDAIFERTARVVVGESLIRIECKSTAQADGPTRLDMEIPWTAAPSLCSTQVQPDSDREPDPKLLQAVVRAHAWLANLRSERFSSIQELATAAKLHPKVVRQALRLAFLAPGVTSAILDREQPERLTLRTIPKLLSLAWTAHQELLD